MISRQNSRFMWKAHFHFIGCRFDEILWSILFVYWGISMTPVMMSALTSHTTLKHNYYYTTQHLHCDITDISNSPCNFDAGSLSIGWSAVLTTLWPQSDDILTTIWPHFDYILPTFCQHSAYILPTFAQNSAYILPTFCLHSDYILTISDWLTDWLGGGGGHHEPLMYSSRWSLI